MALKDLPLPAVIIIAVVSLFGDVRCEGAIVQVKQGESVVLTCPLSLTVDVSTTLQVVEWVLKGSEIPVLIKFGAYPPRVHPKYDGRVSLVEGTSLRVRGLVLEDNGWYECRILLLDKPSYEGRNGSWILLSVTAPPIFSKTPPSVTEAVLGQPATLTCVARGNPMPIITWFKDGTTVTKTDAVMVINGSLIFSSANRNTAGRYQCQASNSEGNVIHSMQLRVKGPPVILIPPTDTVLNMSKNALLRCQAEADPPNMTYVWMKEDENIYHIESLKSRVKVMVDGTLLISHLIPADSGNFTCMPTNGLPTPPTASAILTVRHPAQVTRMPEKILLPTGLKGVIPCPLVAEPPLLRVEWTKNGKSLDLNAYPGWILSADGSILITTANDDVVGVYTCTPYNSYGTMGQSPPTNVILQDPPSLIIAPSKEYREEVGRLIVVPCRATGDPTPKITWTKLGSTIADSQFSVSVDGSLLLRSLGKEHSGEWECSVTNGISTITATTSITVLGTSPHAVSSVTVEAQVHQANVTWIPGFDGGHAQTFTVWLKCLCSEEDQQEWRAFPESSSGTSLLVTDLLPSTEYQFSVMAQNKLGSGPFSEITTAKTTEPVSMPFNLEPPKQLSSNQTSEGLYLSWEAPQSQNPTIDSYVLQVRTDEGEWANLEDSIGADQNKMFVQGLQKNNNYELRLLSRSGGELSMPSPAIKVSTHVDMNLPSSHLPDTEPQSLWTVVVLGMVVLCIILLLALAVVCLFGRRRIWRHRKQDDHTAAVTKADLAPDSPDSALKQKLLPLRPLSSSSSSSDHSTLDKSNRNDNSGQREHLLPRTHTPSQTSMSGNQLRRPSIVDLIHRGADGRFKLEHYEEIGSMDTFASNETARQDFPKLSERAGNASLRKSQSFMSYRSERDSPFVVSVDMPPCGLNILSSGKARTLPSRGCYSVPLGQEVSARSSLCSEISGSVLYPPSETYSSLKNGINPTTASSLVLQMEHEKEKGNLSHCLRLAREREHLENELRKYSLDRDLSANYLKRGGSVRIDRRNVIEEDEESTWTSKGSLHLGQLSNRGHCLPNSPIVRASSCIPWESGQILSASNLMPTQLGHERGNGYFQTPYFNQLSNHRRAVSLERGIHQRSLGFDQRRRRTLAESGPVNFDSDLFYPTIRRAYNHKQGQNTGYNHREHLNTLETNHLAEEQKNNTEGRTATAGYDKEMSVDEPQERASTAHNQDNNAVDSNLPQTAKENQTVIEVGYKTIQRGSRRGSERLRSHSSRTLPLKYVQRPPLQKGLRVGSQNVNHHKSAPSLIFKRYKEEFLPPDAWIDSLTIGQNSSLSPIPSRPGSLSEENPSTPTQETKSEIQLQDTNVEMVSNTQSAFTTEQNSHQNLVSEHPSATPMEESSWPTFHCYSPEPEGSCRSYASQSSGRGSLDHPRSRQSLSFSPPLTNSLDIPEESDKDEAPDRFRRDSVDDHYEWDSHPVSLHSTNLKTSITPVCLEADVLNKGRQRNPMMEPNEKKVLYSSSGILPTHCEESLLAQEIQHGSTCYPDPVSEGVLF